MHTFACAKYAWEHASLTSVGGQIVSLRETTAPSAAEYFAGILRRTKWFPNRGGVAVGGEARCLVLAPPVPARAAPSAAASASAVSRGHPRTTARSVGAVVVRSGPSDRGESALPVALEAGAPFRDVVLVVRCSAELGVYVVGVKHRFMFYLDPGVGYPSVHT